MEAEAGPSLPREQSLPAVIISGTPPPLPNVPTKKRRHGAASHVTASSPAPSDPGTTPTPAPENHVVLPARHLDLSTRPRLTISRHPQFIPLFPGSIYCNTEPLCNNRLNFRYYPAGIAPPESALPFRTIESAPTSFRVSWEDRSPFLKVTQDGLGLLGEKGFRSARCNAPVREGKWYMEIQVELGGGEKPPDSKRREGSHVRLGWARREAPLNGPAGLDGYSYAIRDSTGEKVHLSRLRPYAKPFASGDVIGMYISLPSPRRSPNKKDPYDPAHIKRERIAIEFKGQEYFECLEYTQSKEMIALMDANDRKKATDTSSVPSSTKKSATVKNLPSSARGTKGVKNEQAPLRPLPTLGPDSHIAYFINGECQGVAFQDLFDYLPLRTQPKANEKKKSNKEGLREHKENPFDDGTLGYYPFISLFNEARVRINPGPNFAFPPPPDIDSVLSAANQDVDIKPSPNVPRTWRPICERYDEFIAEQKALDVLEEAQAAKSPEEPMKEPKKDPVKEHKKPAPKEASKEPMDDDQLRASLEKLERHREKRRAQAAARRERARKAKEEEAEREAKRRKMAEEELDGAVQGSEAGSQTYDGRFGPATVSTGLSPATFPEQAAYADQAYSPAPSVELSASIPVSRQDSEYNTENEELEGESLADPVQEIRMEVDGMSSSLPITELVYRERAPGPSFLGDRDDT